MVSCLYIIPRKILFPLFTNTPPKHCLRCLLSFFCLLAAVFTRDRRAATLPKGRKNDSRQRVCEGRRNIFVNGGNNLFFVGSDIPYRKRQDTCHLDSMND